jgi:hypothetical protein
VCSSQSGAFMPLAEVMLRLIVVVNMFAIDIEKKFTNQNIAGQQKGHNMYITDKLGSHLIYAFVRGECIYTLSHHASNACFVQCK